MFILKRSWFTKLDDVKLATKINEFMGMYPNTYKAEIARKCYISKQRLNRLAEEGYIFLPRNKRKATNGLKVRTQNELQIIT
jgi:hypothetical protein